MKVEMYFETAYYESRITDKFNYFYVRSVHKIQWDMYDQMFEYGHFKQY